MPLRVREARVQRILTRVSGYLRGVTSHSLQPYRGCTYGSSLCGVGCYVQHNGRLTRGAAWGSFLDVRVNSAERYRADAEGEARWARRETGRFSVFLSSSTDPFVPQERAHGVTRSVLEAMLEAPPDELVIQTHSHRVAERAELLARLGRRADVRVHVSVESDRDRLPGLPPPASSVRRRLDAARALRRAGIATVVTVAPLLPIRDPEAFFRALGEVADAVVIDHFVGGDGSAAGGRTRRTPLPAAMAAVEPRSTELAYRDAVVEIARRILPGRVGVGADGFAGRRLPS